MAVAPARIVGLGLQDMSDGASAVINSSMTIGADARFIIEKSELGEFDRGLIDWRGILESKHWLVLSSSCPLYGGSIMAAWGSALTFAELEGCKTAMVVDMPENLDLLEEAWGSVIERIRQVSLIFLGPKVVRALSKLEGIEERLLLGEIRSRSLVPIVCSFDPETSIASISHSLGQEIVNLEEGMSIERWLAGFLCGLPQSGSGASGIISAAQIISG